MIDPKLTNQHPDWPPNASNEVHQSHHLYVQYLHAGLNNFPGILKFLARFAISFNIVLLV